MRHDDVPIGRYRLQRFCLWLLLLPAFACGSALPDHAKPKMLGADVARIDAADTIRYRRLTREDFLGTSMPPQFGGDPSQFGATTCVYLRSSADAEIVTQPVAGGGFEARARNVGFVALMDRGCSWWNQHQQAFTRDYVLQHEQIHFAIFEIEARQLNAAAGEIEESSRTLAESAPEARSECEAKLRELMQERLEAVMERSTEFDEDTSAGYDTRKQLAWKALVEKQLSALSP